MIICKSKTKVDAYFQTGLTSTFCCQMQKDWLHCQNAAWLPLNFLRHFKRLHRTWLGQDFCNLYDEFDNCDALVIFPQLGQVVRQGLHEV